MSVKKLILIGGPTASGKSTVALQLAKELNAEIINADSRQVYQEVQIGVNKPPASWLQEVTHHLIGHVSIHQPYNVGLFEQDASLIIRKTLAIKNHLVVVGGTGLYMKALIEGIDEFVEIPDQVKAKIHDWNIQGGIEKLQAELKLRDPEHFQKIDIQNPRRLSRALEVIYSSGLPYSQFLKKKTKSNDFTVVPIFINERRDLLYEKINARVDQMILEGLPKEAELLYPHRSLKALQTVGYTEWFQYMDKLISYKEAIEKIKQHTRNYAKRQWTWWRPLNWPTFHYTQVEEMLNYINLNQ